jgi:hypothetical protein
MYIVLSSLLFFFSRLAAQAATKRKRRFMRTCVVCVVVPLFPTTLLKKWGTQNCKNQLEKIIESKEEDNNGNGPGSF